MTLIPHTDNSFRSVKAPFILDGHLIKVFSIYREGIRIHRGKGSYKTYSWEYLLANAATDEGEPFGQFTPIPQDPTPTEPTEPDFL